MWEVIGKGLVTILRFIIDGQDQDVNLSREDRVPHQQTLSELNSPLQCCMDTHSNIEPQ